MKGLLVAFVSALFLVACGAAVAPEEDWTLEIPPDAVASSLASPQLQALADRLAGDDPKDAAAAWIEIGARYRSSEEFLSDFRSALYDPRPIRFEMGKERMSGGGSTFTYFTPKTPGAKGLPAYAHTVGQALCYHLWQYEDVSNSGFEGTFKTWWAGYAPARGLPGPR